VTAKVPEPVEGPKHIAKIYRKNACQEVFGEPLGFVHAFFLLSDLISLEINDVILTWTKFCPYENPNPAGVAGH
jgi:hypothetical protein